MITVICEICKGEGTIPCMDCNSTGLRANKDIEKEICPICNGEKTLKCPGCLGTGLVDISAMA